MLYVTQKRFCPIPQNTDVFFLEDHITPGMDAVHIVSDKLLLFQCRNPHTDGEIHLIRGIEGIGGSLQVDLFLSASLKCRIQRIPIPFPCRLVLNQQQMIPIGNSVKVHKKLVLHFLFVLLQKKFVLYLLLFL